MISNNYSKNILYFRTPEILLFVTYLLLGGLATIKQPEFGLGAFMLGGLSYVFLIIEHKTQIIFDKVNGKLICKTKALFFPIDKLNHIALLSDILTIYVSTVFDNSNYGNSVNTYKLAIKLKNQKIIYPFGNFSSSNKTKYDKICQRINKFLYQEETPTLVIKESPFWLRLVFGLPLSFMYILSSLYIINPEMMKSVIEQILYYLIPVIEVSGWHFVP